MKYMVTFQWQPDAQKQAEGIARFRKTEGRPPQGVKLLGRWTRADFSGGFALVEAEDAKALTEFGHKWSDLMELRIMPVVDDPELLEVLKRVAS
jgi:hypothetical protein